MKISVQPKNNRQRVVFWEQPILDKFCCNCILPQQDQLLASHPSNILTIIELQLMCVKQ